MRTWAGLLAPRKRPRSCEPLTAVCVPYMLQQICGTDLHEHMEGVSGVCAVDELAAFVRAGTYGCVLFGPRIIVPVSWRTVRAASYWRANNPTSAEDGGSSGVGCVCV